MAKPVIRKNGDVWQVTIGTHLYAARATHAGAWHFAENVANYARCIRLKHDIARTRAALDRMENR